MALNGYANYSRQMPIGKTEVSYSLRYEDRQQIAMAPNSAIIGEALTLNTISPVALGQIRVVPGSVSVWNQTRSQSYTEGIDYVLTVVSLTTRIQRVPSGNILDGQTVLVDYEIDVGGTYANTQLDQSVGLSFMPAPYMSFFLRYSDSTAKLTSGSPTSFLNGYTSTVYGFNANGPLWFSPRFFGRCFFKELFGIFMGNGFWIGIFWNFSVLLTICNIWAKTTIKNFNAIAKIGNIFFGFSLQFSCV